jgi:hypothetical protein
MRRLSRSNGIRNARVEYIRLPLPGRKNVTDFYLSYCYKTFYNFSYTIRLIIINYQQIPRVSY